MLVVPGGPASCVDGPFGRAQEGRLGLALAGGPLPGREACADRLEEPVQGSIPAAAGKKYYTCDHVGETHREKQRSVCCLRLNRLSELRTTSISCIAEQQ